MKTGEKFVIETDDADEPIENFQTGTTKVTMKVGYGTKNGVYDMADLSYIRPYRSDLTEAVMRIT